MHPALSRIDHRPWPLPGQPWTWRQTWQDLLFAHWAVPARDLERFVPPGLTVQEFDGTSWVGVVPFRMEGVMRRPLPDLPGVSAFPEMNLRLYVERDGRPGVWFISLDAANALAVWAARRFFHLPYFRADMRVQRDGDRVRYTSRRRDTGSPVEFRGTYGPVGAPYEAARGTLDHFLTERYCLYARHPSGALLTADIHHAPWALQRAEAAIEVDHVGPPQGINLAGPPAYLHFARHQDVIVWSPRRVT